MSHHRLIFVALLCLPMLDACTSSYWAEARASQRDSSPVGGYPDCRDDHRVELGDCANEVGSDRANIEKLQSRFEEAVSSQDAKAYGALFTDDAVVEDSAGVFRGREAIVGEFTRETARFSNPGARHVVSNAVIRFNGHTATSTSTWAALYHDAYGGYEDEFVKHDGKWLFTKRKIIGSYL